VSDQLGSVRLIVNIADSTDVLFAANYSAFGIQEVLTGVSEVVPFGFAGGMLDEATGLVRFGARDYDPGVGRWTSKDPIRTAGGMNLYAYVDGDPVQTGDPLGLYGLFGGWTGNLTAFFLNFNKSSLGFAPFRTASCADGPEGDVEGDGFGFSVPPQAVRRFS